MANKAVKRLFFDIEVSPNLVYTWNVGYKQQIDYHNIVKERAIICICWRWEGDKKINEVHWDSKQSDKKLLQEFIKVANQADELIAHNGDRFDLPWIRTRCLFHNIDMFPNYTSIDTLKKVRSKFRLNSNRLDYISSFLGGTGKKGSTPGLWTEVMDNKPGALDKMVKYCKNDIVILENVYKRLAPYITGNTHHGVIAGKGKCSCTECSSQNVSFSKRRVTAAGTVKLQFQCNDCHRYFTVSEASYKKEILHGK